MSKNKAADDFREWIKARPWALGAPMGLLDEALAAERQAGFDAGYKQGFQPTETGNLRLQKARRSSGWQPMRDGIDYDSSEQ